MIHGLLRTWNTLDNHILYRIEFKCPKCNELHDGFASTTPNHYKKDIPSHIWKIKINTISENKAILDITPSYDASKICGWHGPYNWQIEAMTFREYFYRNEKVEKWLDIK